MNITVQKYTETNALKSMNGIVPNDINTNFQGT